MIVDLYLVLVAAIAGAQLGFTAWQAGQDSRDTSEGCPTKKKTRG